MLSIDENINLKLRIRMGFGEIVQRKTENNKSILLENSVKNLVFSFCFCSLWKNFQPVGIKSRPVPTGGANWHLSENTWKKNI